LSAHINQLLGKRLKALLEELGLVNVHLLLQLLRQLYAKSLYF